MEQIHLNIKQLNNMRKMIKDKLMEDKIVL